MENFALKIQKKFLELQESGKLFRSSLTGNTIWSIYLNSFKPEHNLVFRDNNSSEHNCNHCNNFIRRYGNIISINSNYEIETMFDVELEPTDEYYNFVQIIKKELKNSKIQDVFFESFNELKTLPYESCKKTNNLFRLGVQSNHKIYTKEEADKYPNTVIPGRIYKFNHFYIDLKREFVDFTDNSVESIIAKYRDDKNVFKRGLDEIHLDTLNLVKDLINQNSLLNGESQLSKIKTFIKFKQDYNKLNENQKDNWCWITSYKLPIAKFRNELIGTLCVELTEGKELNEACQTWNKRVDPANYMKAVAPISKTQIKLAQQFVEENGYLESFDRRFATITDINVEEILHTNAGDGKIKTASLFDKVQSSTSTRHKRSQFDNVEEVNIEKFMKDILPNCTNIEAFFENRMVGNLVALTTANVKDSKPMFKWNNNFSWTYNGNLTGKSQIKENVKSAGGKITGILRCSLQWNDEETKGIVDFDLHCKTPYNEIYYSNKKCSVTEGWLDVDMVNPNKIGIENITWQKTLKDGNYYFFVRNFNGNNNAGFKVEIEFDGNVYDYHHSIPLSYKQDIKVATVTIKNGQMSIQHHLQETITSKKLWNLNTNEFHKVNLVCLSPNYWGNNNIGNKHYLFMLNDCYSDIPLRSFHNENLNNELLQHRKVMDVLGNTTMLEPTNTQLAGLGFNSTVNDELILKIKGSHQRIIKVLFNK